MTDVRRVLVVEDEAIAAMLIGDVLRRAGYAVVGPAPRLPEALRLAAEGGIVAAVLDVNLAGADVFPVADVLSASGIPFLFLTGYTGDVLPARYADRPVVGKPYRLDDLPRLVGELLDRAARG